MLMMLGKRHGSHHIIYRNIVPKYIDLSLMFEAYIIIVIAFIESGMHISPNRICIKCKFIEPSMQIRI